MGACAAQVPAWPGQALALLVHSVYHRYRHPAIESECSLRLCVWLAARERSSRMLTLDVSEVAAKCECLRTPQIYGARARSCEGRSAQVTTAAQNTDSNGVSVDEFPRRLTLTCGVHQFKKQLGYRNMRLKNQAHRPRTQGGTKQRKRQGVTRDAGEGSARSRHQNHGQGEHE